MVDDLRAAGLFQRDQVIQRHQAAAVRPHVVLAQVGGIAAELLVRLDINPVRPVVVVEIVHIRRAHVGAHRRRDLGERHAHGTGFLTIDGDEELWVVGAEGGVQPNQAGRGIEPLCHHLVRDAVNIVEGVASGVLQNELESAHAANAVDRRRLYGEEDAAGNAEELRPHIRNDRVRVMS